ncbi:MAG: hypothetical protein U0R78_08540 [Nocardioidaceae bacterium]
MATHAKRKSRKKFVWVFTAVLLLGVGGTAYAYWTAGGSGTGTATTGTSSAVTVVQTSTVTNLQPGGAAQTLTGTFNNPNTGPVYVATVTASIGSVTKAVGAPAGTCDATDYTLSNATMTVAAEVPAGNAQGSWTGATIAFNNKAATNQDACKGATVTLAYTVA